MQVINMNELNYDSISDVEFTMLPCEIELLIKGLETYMFIYHNIYSQHDDGDELWTRDYIAMNLYNKLITKCRPNYKTKYDVYENSRRHATVTKRDMYARKKARYRKAA